MKKFVVSLLWEWGDGTLVKVGKIYFSQLPKDTKCWGKVITEKQYQLNICNEYEGYDSKTRTVFLKQWNGGEYVPNELVLPEGASFKVLKNPQIINNKFWKI